MISFSHMMIKLSESLLNGEYKVNGIDKTPQNFQSPSHLNRLVFVSVFKLTQITFNIKLCKYTEQANRGIVYLKAAEFKIRDSQQNLIMNFERGKLKRIYYVFRF